MCGAMKTPCENYRFCENWTTNAYCDECWEGQP